MTFPPGCKFYFVISHENLALTHPVTFFFNLNVSHSAVETRQGFEFLVIKSKNSASASCIIET